VLHDVQTLFSFVMRGFARPQLQGREKIFFGSNFSSRKIYYCWEKELICVFFFQMQVILGSRVRFPRWAFESN
jgi:hypothetical protein